MTTYDEIYERLKPSIEMDERIERQNRAKAEKEYLEKQEWRSNLPMAIFLFSGVLIQFVELIISGFMFYHSFFVPNELMLIINLGTILVMEIYKAVVFIITGTNEYSLYIEDYIGEPWYWVNFVMGFMLLLVVPITVYELDTAMVYVSNFVSIFTVLYLIISVVNCILNIGIIFSNYR